MPRSFLVAEWRKLIMVNYAVDENLLLKLLPAKTEIDLWEGKCYISLVGFMFKNTRVMGVKIPFHVNFEEVNLRFYVRYNNNGEWKRGVVFIKEIVPKHAITLIANSLYNENYETRPMQHSWQENADLLNVEYHWKTNNWNSIKVSSENKLLPIPENSHEEFITEHYWGYTKINETKTSEYEVKHPKWEIYKTNDFVVNVDFENVYGNDFGFLTNQKPESVFLAEGSEIEVKAGKVV